VAQFAFVRVSEYVGQNPSGQTLCALVCGAFREKCDDDLFQFHRDKYCALGVYFRNHRQSGDFVANFYPDLIEHLSTSPNPRNCFTGAVKNGYIGSALPDLNAVNAATVTFISDISQMYRTGSQAKDDFALTVAQLAYMIKLSGIAIHSLPEETFDSVDIKTEKPDAVFSKKTVYGFAEARQALESIRKGGCDAQWVLLHP